MINQHIPCITKITRTISEPFSFTVVTMLKLLRQLRGGVNQLLLCLNNFNSIKPFLIFLQVIINIIQHMDNINNEHQSHIRYTKRHIFMRKPIKGENLFFFKMIGSILSFVHHLCLRTNSK
jgi:hypothetical protein